MRLIAVECGNDIPNDLRNNMRHDIGVYVVMTSVLKNVQCVFGQSNADACYRKSPLRTIPDDAAQISVVTLHQYGISALVPQTSSRGETTGGIAKCRLFSQASMHPTKFWPFKPTNGDRPHIREDAMCKLTGGIY